MQISSSIKNLAAGSAIIAGVVVAVFVLVHSVFFYSNDDVLTVGSLASRSNSVSKVQTKVNAKSGKSILVKKNETAAVDVSTSGNSPATLVIPKISLRAHVQQVGLTSKGNMASPNNFFDVGWYKSGPPIGEKGTAVVDGHLDDGLGLPAVFWRLSEVNYGDEIDVITKDGHNLRFVVSGLNTYDYNDKSAAIQIFSQADEPTLRLITCDGSWVKDDKTYNKRLVVTANLMSV